MDTTHSTASTDEERAIYGRETDATRNRRLLSGLQVGEGFAFSEPDFVLWPRQDVAARLKRHAQSLVPARFKIKPTKNAVVATRIA